MRKAKEQAASRICACAPGVEPWIRWKLEKSYIGLKRKPHSWFPHLSYFLSPPSTPAPSPFHGVWIR